MHLPVQGKPKKSSLNRLTLFRVGFSEFLGLKPPLHKSESTDFNLEVRIK